MESTMYRQRRRPFKPWVPLWLRWFVTWWTSAQNCNDGMFDELNTPGGSPPQSRIEFLNRPSILHHTLDSRVRPILQSQSAFNILPLEVRQQIWKDTVGGHAFHLAIHGHDRRFVGWMCGTPDPSTCRMNRYGGRCWPLPLSKAETEERRNMLALLRTCRQMYTEAVELLYSANSFTIFDSDVMYYLPSILVPELANSIRSLRFIWDRLTTPPLGPRSGSDTQQVEDIERQDRWTKIWHNIAGMQNLQELEVMLQISDRSWGSLDADNARVLFQPIKQVTLPANFLLVLPYLAMSSRRTLITHSGPLADRRNSIDLWVALPCDIQLVESICEFNFTRKTRSSRGQY